MAELDTDTPGHSPASVGERLKAAREAAGLDLADVASRTRIPLRHLQALETDDFDALPSPTYSVGFAKAHARVVGLDEVDIAAGVRGQLDRAGRDRFDYVPHEPADPARVPPRLLAWTAAAIAVLLLIGYGVWRTVWLNGAAPSVTTEVATNDSAAPAPAATPTPGPAAAATGPVVLTATDAVWVRIYDADNNRLLQKEMAVGERYEVPADANNPQILTGRPQALRVTVGGQEVAPLGDADKTVKDVGISAAALAARANPPVPAPAPAETAATRPARAPAAGPTPVPTPVAPEPSPTAIP